MEIPRRVHGLFFGSPVKARAKGHAPIATMTAGSVIRMQLPEQWAIL
jgi:hypothetical protein